MAMLMSEDVGDDKIVLGACGYCGRNFMQHLIFTARPGKILLVSIFLCKGVIQEEL